MHIKKGVVTSTSALLPLLLRSSQEDCYYFCIAVLVSSSICFGCSTFSFSFSFPFNTALFSDARSKALCVSARSDGVKLHVTTK